MIFATGFYPYGYGYYPYGGYYPYDSYSYYDDRYYDDRYASNEYTEQSDYDSRRDRFERQRRSSPPYRGKDITAGQSMAPLGPETRNALRRYQRDRGLTVTGRVDRATMNALGLR